MKRQLGRTELQVTPIGLGCWQFSEGRGGAIGSWDAISAELTTDIIRAAIDGGIHWFDTAEAYGWGRSERGLARGLQSIEHPDDIVIATKWSPFLRTARSLRNTIDTRIDALAPYPVDLHQIHAPVAFSSIDTQMGVMADLLEAGKIRAAGVSNFSADQMRRAHEALVKRGQVLASNQVRYNLADRGIEFNGILDTAAELGITIIAYSPLGMGLMTGKFHDDPSLLDRLPFGRRFRLRRRLAATQPIIDVLGDVAGALGVSRSQVAVAWVLRSRGDTVVAIPGASKVRHATEAAGSMAIELSDDDFVRLERASRR